MDLSEYSGCFGRFGLIIGSAIISIVIIVYLLGGRCNCGCTTIRSYTTSDGIEFKVHKDGNFEIVNPERLRSDTTYLLDNGMVIEVISDGRIVIGDDTYNVNFEALDKLLGR